MESWVDPMDTKGKGGYVDPMESWVDPMLPKKKKKKK